MNVLYIILGLSVVWILYVVSGGSGKAPNNQPHVLRVTFRNGYKTEFQCDSFYQGLDFLERLDNVVDCSLTRLAVRG